MRAFAKGGLIGVAAGLIMIKAAGLDWWDARYLLLCGIIWTAILLFYRGKKSDSI